MARLLYRLGLSSARRPVVVMVAWLLVILAAGGAALGLSRPLSNAFKVPHAQFQQVLDEVGREIPAVSGGTGTVVFHTTDGRAFTAQQRAAVTRTLTAWQRIPHVIGTVDPFSTEQRIQQQASKLRAGERQLAAGQSKYDRAVHRLQQAQWLAEQGRKDIARIRATHPADPTLPARESGQRRLESQLAGASPKLYDARQRLARGQAELYDGQTLSRLSDGFHMVAGGGSVALAQVRFDTQPQSVPADDLAQVPSVGTRQLAGTGVQADYGLEIVHTTDAGSVGEVVGLAVAAVVLLVMLGSLVLSGLPLVIAFTGVGASVLAGLVITHWTSLHQMAPVLGAMLGLAVGIDYALFIINRHRHQLADLGREPSREEIRHSIGLATGTAGNAVVVAGATVVIALSALTVSGIPVLVQMGLLAAFTVLTTVLVALTLTPALLSLAGRRAVPRRRRNPRPGSSGWPHRWAAAVTARPGLTVTAVVLLVAILAIPATQLRLGLPDGGSEPLGSTAYRSYSLVERSFGAGSNGPILAAARLNAPVAPSAELRTERAIAQSVAATPGIRSVLPVGVSADRHLIAFQIVPSEGPSSASTVAAVRTLQGTVHDQLARTGVDLGLTGQTVANIEISQRLADALPLYLGLVIGLSLLLLAIVFRSIVVPLLATAGFLLSLAGSFGAIVAVYQWGWLGPLVGVHDPSAIFSFLPTLLVGILFGLAMDYQMFLVSGMHEAYAHGEAARAAVRTGFTSGARVVAAAALIMTSVFAGFVFSPMTMARPLGFGLAVGVLIDAFVVRMALIPAAMTLLGDRAWWMPVWLERILPRLDVEGSALVELQRPARPQQAREDALV